MVHLSIGTRLVKHPGKKQYPVQATVKGTYPFAVLSGNPDAAKLPVPDVPAFQTNLIEIFIPGLQGQISFRLFQADERRSNLYLHLFAFPGPEANYRTAVETFTKCGTDAYLIFIPGVPL
jgi:hypothetical protein